MISSKGVPSLTNLRTFWTGILAPATRGFPKWISGLTSIFVSVSLLHHRQHAKAPGATLFGAVREKLSGVAGGAQSRYLHLRHAGRAQLIAVGRPQIEVHRPAGLSQQPPLARCKASAHLRRHLWPYLVATRPDRRPHAGHDVGWPP